MERLAVPGPRCMDKDWVMSRRVLAGTAAQPECPWVMWTRFLMDMEPGGLGTWEMDTAGPRDRSNHGPWVP